VDDGTITLTTRASAAGTWDVVVQDVAGPEGRSGDALEFAPLPEIDSVFPAAGFGGGGTLVRLRGLNFVTGSIVRIDGDQQTGVTVASANSLSFSTSAGLPGGPYVLEVETPDGDVASALFTFQIDPDPIVATIEPASGSTRGGDVIVITGSNFTADVEVSFGANPETGLGGVAADVVFVDANTLEVTTPPSSAGAKNVLVRLALTDQAALESAAFTFTSPPSGGGGGGCYVVPLEHPRAPFDGFLAFLPILLAFAWIVGTARRPQLARARVSPRR
jgi:hypothetical protein